ncbi:hypothetical protein NCCP1664_08390 [Zafaria cholistanensis]|uniref:Putative zinc-finger domain-containing protein n=1 Tax=Zafaria cholistanensis TaxID=1682741 RepID=A0A5A7NQD4_9MICC|nr:sigma-70 family RNA polymerase sigma factor [Zafaria cholistanensis]GER22342.1 hypothetical protein NCCP1664_08390 [Zafaria cholistanensis]
MDTSSTNAFTGLPDADLAAAIRAGDSAAGAGGSAADGGAPDAIAVFYARHYGAAVRIAEARLGNRSLAEDVAVDALADLLELIRQGSSCGDAPRPWLACLASRKAFAANRHESLPRAAGAAALFEQGDRDADPVMEQRGSGLLAETFKALPGHCQDILWLLEVENAPAAEAAHGLGLGVEAVVEAAAEAREGLRAAYLEAHGAAAAGEFAEQCHRLGDHLDGALGPRAMLKFEEHLGNCTRCDAALAVIGDLGAGLRTVVAPLFLGAGAASLLPLIDGSALLAQRADSGPTRPGFASPEAAGSAAGVSAAGQAAEGAAPDPTAAVDRSPSGAGPTVVALSDLAATETAPPGALSLNATPISAAPVSTTPFSATSAAASADAAEPRAAAVEGPGSPVPAQHSPDLPTQSIPALRTDAGGTPPRASPSPRMTRKVRMRRRLLPSAALAGAAGVLVAGVAFAATGTLPLPSGATDAVSEVIPVPAAEDPAPQPTHPAGGGTPSPASDPAGAPASETPDTEEPDGAGDGAEAGEEAGAEAPPAEGAKQSAPDGAAPTTTAPKAGNPVAPSTEPAKTNQPSADVSVSLPDPTQPARTSSPRPADDGSRAGQDGADGADGSGAVQDLPAPLPKVSTPAPAPTSTVEVSPPDSAQSNFFRSRTLAPQDLYSPRYSGFQLEIGEAP